MPDKEERRQAAREARIAQQQALAKKERRNKLLTVLGGAFVVVAAVVILITITTSSGGDASNIKGKSEVAAQFKDIPVEGLVVGQTDAPITIVEYFDMQCPFCKQFALEGYADLVATHVKDGNVKIELRPLMFLDQNVGGSDSREAAQAVMEASRQGVGPQFVELFFHNQGTEGSGYVDEDFIRALAQGVNAPDVEAIVEASTDMTRTNPEITEYTKAFTEGGLTGTPGFQIGLTGGELRPYQPSGLSADEFTPIIEDLLAKADK